METTEICAVRKRSVEIPLESLLSGVVYLSGMSVTSGDLQNCLICYRLDCLSNNCITYNIVYIKRILKSSTQPACYLSIYLSIQVGVMSVMVLSSQYLSQRMWKLTYSWNSPYQSCMICWLILPLFQGKIICIIII